MGQIGCPETSVRNYHYSLCNSSEECSCHCAVFGFHLENSMGICTSRNYAHKWTIISVRVNLEFCWHQVVDWNK